MKFTLILPLLAVVLMGCESLMTREAVRENEQRREMTTQVSTLQRTTADVNNRFAELESELRELNGKIEVSDNRTAQSAKNQESQRKQTEEVVNELQKRVQVLQEEITRMQDQIATLAAAQTAVQQRPEPEGSRVERGHYEQAEELFDQKEWKRAILAYQKFRDAKPADKRVPSAIYKIGVCFQEVGMKDEARTFFEEAISKYPKSDAAKRSRVRIARLKK